MTHHFRPRIESLEARDVPAAFSAVLPSGAVVSGSFSTPEGVDPAQSSQSLALTDLSVTKGGVAYTTQPGATAQYAYGALVGVLAAATGPDTIQITNGTLQVSLQSAPVVYDAADTQAAFTLPDGTAGALSYAMPYDQIDATQASQSVPLITFNLNIRGQNFAYGMASYTTAPTLHFEYGDLVSLSFALDTSALSGFAYSNISAVSGTATAQLAANGQFVNAPVVNTSASLTIDFSSISIPGQGQAAVEVSMRVTLADGTTKTVTVEISAGATKTQVRNAFETALTGVGITAKASDTTGLTIQGSATQGLKQVDVFNFGADAPKVVTRTKDGAGNFPTYKSNN